MKMCKYEPDRPMTESELKRQRKQVLKEALVKVPKIFRPEMKVEITTSMIRKAVDEAINDLTVFDAAMALRFGHLFCEKCGECCRMSDPIIICYEDIFSLARFLGVSPTAVIANYLIELKDGTFSLRTKPCVFLMGNQCSVYLARPMICRQFPVTMVGGHGGLLNYSYCSFVKNLLLHKSKGLIVRDLFLAKHAVESTECLKETSKETARDFSKQFSFANALSDFGKLFSEQAKPEEKKNQSSKQ